MLNVHTSGLRQRWKSRREEKKRRRKKRTKKKRRKKKRSFHLSRRENNLHFAD